MKKIYLKDRNSNWKEFDYKLLSELADEFKKRNIKIGEWAKIEAGAKIEADAKIGEFATIGADAMIGESATIGECATIGAYAKIGARATIEADAKIGVGAKIGADAKIGARATIEAGAKIGVGAKIGADAKIGAGTTIEAGAKIGALATIGKYNSFFTVNLYKYSCGAWVDSRRGEMIQLGCFTRTREEWDSDFWNNDDEFPNDGSEKSNARLRAFKICCYFLDLIKN